ncbi:MAG TPA: hypothetical protein VMV69_21215 [Pirellulales bacterium]|nr:hypothetical protein [Pirellulales bacterium]
MEAQAIYTTSSDGALRQGEVISGLIQVHLKLSLGGDMPATSVIQHKSHPFAIVVSQDCELDWDFKARNRITIDGKEVGREKTIPNVLFCEVWTADALRGSNNINSTMWSKIKTNRDERYHFLEKIDPTTDRQALGLPELGIDFKRYFTIPTDEAYARVNTEAKRRCRLVSPYLEHFSGRFFYFQSRVALPREHESEPGSPQ